MFKCNSGYNGLYRHTSLHGNQTKKIFFAKNATNITKFMHTFDYV